nr:hypothetical protein [Tanacetum cinerariifolium]
MSSPNHPTSGIEDAFSSNFPIPAYSDYFPATPRNISSDFLENYKNEEILPVFSPFYNNLYLKDMQAFCAKELPISPPDPITPPIILTPSTVLPPSLLFDPRYFFVPEELLSPKKQIRPPSSSSTTLSNSSRKQACILKMEERLVNGWIIIPKDFDEVKTKLKEARTQIRELQKKHMRHRDKIAFVHFRISDLEMTLEDIQDLHQLYVKNLMGHTS